MQEGVRTSCPGNLVGVSKETRKERVPVARAFVEVREKPGGRGYLCPGDFGWGVGRQPRRERVPVARGFGGGSKGNQEKEGPSSPGFC
jgi:hypothetical protein